MKRRMVWVMVVFGFLAAVGFGKEITTIKMMDEEIAGLEDRYTALVTEKRELEDITEDLENLSYVEVLAREELNMVYPGEVLYIEAKPL